MKNNYKESGRSMLEMLMMVALIILLTMGALEGYQQLTNKRQAAIIHEDIMTRAQAEFGKNFRDKKVYDSKLGNSKTRTGHSLQVEPLSNMFGVIVKDLTPETCRPLKKKVWQDAKEFMIIHSSETDIYTSASGINCPKENFDLSVIFPKRESSSSESEMGVDLP